VKYLAVKGFDSFQHYKNRNPPWIKFYFGVLEDYSLLQLAEVTQRHLFTLWLVASRYDGFLPDDRKYLATAIKARGRVDWDALIAAGFLEIIDETERAKRLAGCLQDASADDSSTLADRKHDAIASRARESNNKSQSQNTETETSTTSRDAVVRFVVAANNGLADHVDPKRRQIDPINASSAASLDAAASILNSGVTADFAVEAIGRIARSCEPSGRVNSLRYFVPAVVRAWEERDRPPGPRGNGKRTPPGQYDYTPTTEPVHVK